MERTGIRTAALLTLLSSAPLVKRLDGRARLLCDGTNLREGGEVKGKQVRQGVSLLRATPTQKPADRGELSTPRKRMTHPFRSYMKIVFCACAITL
jgi:hypothetical protein